MYVVETYRDGKTPLRRNAGLKDENDKSSDKGHPTVTVLHPYTLQGPHEIPLA